MKKPILLGMCNPHSDDPAMALYPRPPGATGHRVLKLLQDADPDATESDYLRGFQRMNLLPGRRWDRLEAYRRGPRLRAELDGRTVLVFGRDVWFALGLGVEGAPWYFLPHPSGLNRWYNEHRNKVRAGKLLSDLLRRRA